MLYGLEARSQLNKAQSSVDVDRARPGIHRPLLRWHWLLRLLDAQMPIERSEHRLVLRDAVEVDAIVRQQPEERTARADKLDRAGSQTHMLGAVTKVGEVLRVGAEALADAGVVFAPRATRRPASFTVVVVIVVVVVLSRVVDE